MLKNKHIDTVDNFIETKAENFCEALPYDDMSIIYALFINEFDTHMGNACTAVTNHNTYKIEDLQDEWELFIHRLFIED